MTADILFDPRFSAKWLCALTASGVFFVPATAEAAVTISAAATKNIVCSVGVCNPNHENAVLNATDLQDLLAAGNVQVTTGTGGRAARIKDIIVNTTVSWASESTLTFDAYRSITINRPISVVGTGGVSLVTNDRGSGGALSFGLKGNVTFSDVARMLTINGVSYTLVRNIATLASDIASEPSGNFALANDYDATADGTYAASPVATTFSGSFEGLGHLVANISIDDADDNSVGFFSFVHDGAVHDVGVVNAHVIARGQPAVGALAGNVIGGVVTGSYSTGRVASTTTRFSDTGGLVGVACNSGSGSPEDLIADSHSSATVSGGQNAIAGGLVGYNCGTGTIEDSYATGVVSGKAGSFVGGLVGGSASTGFVTGSFASGSVTTGDANSTSPPASAGGLIGYLFQGSITNSYALSSVAGGAGTNAGGLVGLEYSGSIEYSYSTGQVTAGTGSYIGGLVGEAGGVSDSYWDTETSGITNPSQGAGNESNAQGITGLTTSQLQAGLPAGFDSSIWGQNPAINGGLPYLLADPLP